MFHLVDEAVEFVAAELAVVVAGGGGDGQVGDDFGAALGILLAEHDYPCTEIECLVQIVGNEQDGGSGFGPQAAKESLHATAGCGVKG